MIQIEGYCKCGCGNKTKIAKSDNLSYGHKAGKPLNYLYHHGNYKPFLSLVDKNANGCWMWRGRQSNGYGVYRTKRAHRYSYEFIKGNIPTGLFLDHLCRTPLCVNPDHLEPVTNAENIRRGKGTKLTFVDIVEIKKLLLRNHWGLKASIAKTYGVSRRHMTSIARGDCWQ